MTEIIALDSLNEKNRIREYKITGKDLKSKDLETRKIALEKLRHDHRYFIEGHCFKPLLESIVVSKKTLELCNVSLETLDFFLDNNNDKDMVISILEEVLEPSTTLPLWNFLSECLILHEEIKIPKQRKNDPTPVEIPIEKEIYGNIRSLSAKILYSISKLIMMNSSDPSFILKNLLQISNLSENLCITILNLTETIQSSQKSVRYEGLKLGTWLLTCLQCMLQCDDSDVFLELVLRKSLIPVLSSLITEPVLAVHSLKNLDFISSKKNALTQFDDSILGRLVDQLSKSASSLRVWNDQQLMSGKAKNTKKEVKSKKGEAVPIDECAEDRLLLLPPHILAIMQMKFCVNILTSIAVDVPTNMTESLVIESIAPIKFICETASVWSLIGNAETQSADAPLRDILDIFVKYFGIIGLVSDEFKVLLCNQGGLLTLTQLFKVSREVHKTLQMSDQDNSLTRFRLLIEKSLITSMTSTDSNRIESSPMYGSPNFLSSIKLVVETINTNMFSNDPELTKFGIRIVSHLMTTKALRSLVDIKVDIPILIKDLSNIFENVSKAYLQTMNSTVESIVEINTDAISAISLVDEYEHSQPIPDENEVVRKLVPSDINTSFDAIVLLTILLEVSSDNIPLFVGNIQDTNNRLNLIGRLMLACGPTAGSLMTTECKIPRFNMLALDWSLKDVTLLQSNTTTENLRSKLLAISSQICFASVAKEWTNITAPGVVPTATITFGNPLEDYAVLTCIELVDICCQILQMGSKLIVNRQNDLVLARSNEGNLQCLENDLLIAVLAFFEGVGKMGVTGICSAVESVAKGFRPNANNTERAFSIHLLRQSIFDNISDLNESLNESFTWNRPKTFQFMNDGSEIKISPLNINRFSNNKFLWPFAVISSSILSKINDPTLSTDVIINAISVMELFTHTKEFETSNQHVVCDCLAASFLGLGGGIAIASLCGRFGLLRKENESRDQAIRFLKYLIDRGHCREAYWQTWREDHKEVIEYDSRGKPKPSKKKEKPVCSMTLIPGNKKKESSKKSAAVALMEDIVFQVEPDPDLHIDPNFGPTTAFWTKLLDAVAPDSYSHSDGTTLFNALIIGDMKGIENNSNNSESQYQLHDVILEVMNLGVNVNIKDENTGMTSLMYSLLLGNDSTVRRLIEDASSNADVNAIDNFGNPVLKFAFTSLSIDQISCTFQTGFLPTVSDKSSSTILVGNRNMLKYFRNAEVDVNVSDDNCGNFPLHWALGLCETEVCLGGYRLLIHGNDYVSSGSYGDIDRDLFRESVYLLDTLGANANVCNKSGVSPLHLLCAKGDLELIQYLISEMAAHPNIESSKNKYLPIHYLTLCCPANSIDCFDYLANASNNLPIEWTDFNDIRKCMTKNERFDNDVQDIVNTILQQSMLPSALLKRRYSWNELLLMQSENNESILQLAMTGHFLTEQSIPNIHRRNISSDKNCRMALVLHILQKLSGSSILNDLLMLRDRFQTTILHCSTILFDGVTPKTQRLTEKELRAKRNKKYESIERHIIDILFSALATEPEATLRDLLLVKCSRRIISKIFPKDGWTLLHGVISSSNHEYAEYLIDIIHYPLYSDTYLHYIANFKTCSRYMAKLIVNWYTKSESPHSLVALNGIDLETNTRPIHLAVKTGNLLVLKELLKSVKVNVNLRDDLHGCTAFHLACNLENLNVVDCFESIIDKVDFLVEDIHGNTCIEAAIIQGNFSTFHRMLSWRRNDVIGRLISKRKYSDSSLLFEIELENIRLVEAMEKLSYQGKINDDIAINAEGIMCSEPVITANATPTFTSGQALYNKNEFQDVFRDLDTLSSTFDSMHIDERNHEENALTSEDKHLATTAVKDDICRYSFISAILQATLPEINELPNSAVIIHANNCFAESKLYEKTAAIVLE